MNEASKTRRLWGETELAALMGSGIDIGCGCDPVTPDVRRFDVTDGDANDIARFVRGQFDFVFSSHCLEDMRNPADAIHQWWQLVKPGGHLFFIVPDEDLYEQGVFPSRFNPSHRATFTISKAASWSPVSHNVLDLALSLPQSELVRLVLQDQGYDRHLLKHGRLPLKSRWIHSFCRVYNAVLRRSGLRKVIVAA
jgi:2-polyprenyl-3-methyl-5-hydroxy-6-metoxy-1,4-benzoquinol methylase